MNFHFWSKRKGENGTREEGNQRFRLEKKKEKF